jgi:lipoprotein-anchoring transpeptidase ErfK/SrfK
MSPGPSWRENGRARTVAALFGVVVLGAAAAVLAADAAGLLGARRADAATVVVAVAPGSTAPTGAVPPTTTLQLTTTTTGTSTNSRRHRRHRRPAVKAHHLSATKLVHLPLTGVADGAAGVAIRLSGTPAPDTPRPEIFPSVAGRWHDIGPYEAFRPTSTLEPCTSYTMLIPAKTIAVGHRALGRTKTFKFSVACPGVEAVQEALARLGYLPYTLHGFIGASSDGRETRGEAAQRAFEPPYNGKLMPDMRDAPPLEVGTVDPTTTGAMDVYEEAHGLPLSTTPSEQLWIELLADETIAHRDALPYTWVTVTETLPETLEVHENGKIALSSPANTGVPGASTQTGIFPIYVRYVSTTMIGTNVDGSHYDDPGVPWVNYFNGGDAVHGYPRPGYGYPQSNGCVELPISTAETVYGMLQVGDLVIVE